MQKKTAFLYQGYSFEKVKELQAVRETARKKEAKRQGRNTLRKRRKY